MTTALFMTASNTPVLGPISSFFGIIINAIYNFFELIFGQGNVNVAFIIFIFTVVVYCILFPLTYHQQKFSSLQKMIQPEVQAINKKYKGKTDQASRMKQQEEIQALYDKYGISMAGSCLQLVIQLPILYALYGVFNSLPAYIDSIRGIFTGLVDAIVKAPEFRETMTGIISSMNIPRLSVDFTAQEGQVIRNYLVDTLYKLPEYVTQDGQVISGWDFVHAGFPSIPTELIQSTHDALSKVNNFLGMSISETPINMISANFSVGNYLLVFLALLIPICSFLSQVLSLKVTQSGNPGMMDANQKQMNIMTKIMPFISLIFVFSVPIGLGLYWIAGALVRSLFVVLLNRHFSKIDLQALIEKNKEKAEIKLKKRQKRNSSIYEAATLSTKKTMSDKANIGTKANKAASKQEETQKRIQEAKPGSLASKANMVTDFNQKKNKDKK